MLRVSKLIKLTNNIQRAPQQAHQLYSFNQRFMKIYTKTGDKGTSALFTGDRMDKDNQIFEALGSIDEVNGYLGLVGIPCDDFGLG